MIKKILIIIGLVGLFTGVAHTAVTPYWSGAQGRTLFYDSSDDDALSEEFFDNFRMHIDTRVAILEEKVSNFEAVIDTETAVIDTIGFESGSPLSMTKTGNSVEIALSSTTWSVTTINAVYGAITHSTTTNSTITNLYGTPNISAGFTSPHSTTTHSTGTTATFTNIVGTNYSGIEDDEVTIDNSNSVRYTNAEDRWNITQSIGKVEGCTLTDNGDGTVTVSTGTCMIRATDSDIGNLVSMHIDSATVTLTNYDLNFIVVGYNAGASTITATTDFSSISLTDEFVAGYCYRQGTDVDVQEIGNKTPSYGTKDCVRLFYRGIERMYGCTVAEGADKHLTATAGKLYLGNCNIDIDAFNSATTDFGGYYYRTASSWTVTASTGMINVLNYDDGSGTLAELGANQYRADWIYACLEGDYYIIMGQSSDTLPQVELRQPPSSIPDYLSSYAILAAKVVVQKSATSIYSIESAFTTKFTPSAVNTHNDLAGLNDGDYQHLTESEKEIFDGYEAQISTYGWTSGNMLRWNGSAWIAVSSETFVSTYGDTMTGGLYVTSMTVTEEDIIIGTEGKSIYFTPGSTTTPNGPWRIFTQAPPSPNLDDQVFYITNNTVYSAGTWQNRDADDKGAIRWGFESNYSNGGASPDLFEWNLDFSSAAVTGGGLDFERAFIYYHDWADDNSDDDTFQMAGKMAIGEITTPVETLHVYGDAVIDSTATIHGLRIQNDGTKTTLSGKDGDYTRIGDSNETGHSLNTKNDLVVTGKLETNGFAYFDSTVYHEINLDTLWGGAAGFIWDNAWSTNKALKFFTYVGAANVSGNIIMCEYADRTTDFGQPIVNDVHLRIQSSNATDTSEYIQFYHNQSDAVVECGRGDLILGTLDSGTTNVVKISDVLCLTPISTPPADNMPMGSMYFDSDDFNIYVATSAVNTTTGDAWRALSY